WEVGDDEAIAAGEGRCRLGDVLAIPDSNFLQGEALIEELAGGVVVLDRETRTGDAVILRGLFDEGQFRVDAVLAEIADADFDRVSRERMAGHDAQTDYADQPSDHGRSLVPPSRLNDDGGTLILQALST